MNLRLTTAFGSRVTFRDPEISQHAWGLVVEGFARVEGQLYEEHLCTRLDTATDVEWLPVGRSGDDSSQGLGQVAVPSGGGAA